MIVDRHKWMVHDTIYELYTIKEIMKVVKTFDQY